MALTSTALRKLQAVIGAVRAVIGAGLMGAFSAAGHAGTFLGSMLAAVGILGLVVGLGVRMVRALTGSGGRTGHERAAHERQARLAVRRPAEGVPPGTSRDLPEDSDPAIALEDD